MIWFWDHYIPIASDRMHSDLVGAPPAAIITAEHGVLRDEAEAFARRLAEAADAERV